jgi:hypothetical protein
MPGDLGHSGLGNPAVEAAIEIARLDRRAMTTGEDQAGLNPRTARAFTIGCLSFAPVFSAVTHRSGSGRGASDDSVLT